MALHRHVYHHHFPNLWINDVLLQNAWTLSLPPYWKSNSFKLHKNATSSIKLSSIKDFPLFTFPYSIRILFCLRIIWYYFWDLFVFIYVSLRYLLILVCSVNLFTCLCSQRYKSFWDQISDLSPLVPTVFNSVLHTIGIYWLM